MTRRTPSAVIVVDANIIVSAILGVRSQGALRAIGDHRLLMTSSRVWSETERVIASAMEARRIRSIELAPFHEIVETADYAPDTVALAAAALSLRNAVASRNGSDRDAHVLALAWAMDADIWSHARDFAGAGWPSWSSANIARALGAEAAAMGQA